MMNFLSLIWSGEQRCEPNYKVGPYERNRYILHYVMDGHGVVEYHGKIWQVTQGQMFVIYKGETISYCADSAKPWHYIWVEFDGLAAEELLDETGFTRQARVSPVLDEELFLPLFYEFRDKYGNASSQLKGNAALCNLFSELVRFFPSDRLLQRGVAERARELLQAGFSDVGCQIGNVAAMVGVSRSQLFRLFKQRYAVSPKEYLNGLRMKHAQKLLSETELPVKEVAYACGFLDPLYFSAAFKSSKGCSPKIFRTRDNKTGEQQ